MIHQQSQTVHAIVQRAPLRDAGTDIDLSQIRDTTAVARALWNAWAEGAVLLSDHRSCCGA